jgi:predicted DNA-binding transcriptional regulator YafY
VRAIGILQRLQGRWLGLLVDDLQAEYGVSRSQIRRDLAALEEAGVRLVFETEEGRYGRARVRLEDADSAQIAITWREQYTLLGVRRVFDVFRNTPWFEDVESVFDKLIASLSARAKRDLRTLAAQVVYRPAGGVKSYMGSEDIIDALQTGVMKRRLVQYSYQARFGAATSGRMAPYAFVIHRNGLYVVASRIIDSEHPEKEKLYAVERFEAAEPIPKTTFEPPADLDVEEHFEGAFGIISGSGSKTYHVVVELSPSARLDAVTRTWHKTQVTTELPSGRVRVEFDVTTLWEVVPWVLEWGPRAKVIGPPELRKRVIRALREMAHQYEI